MAFGKQFALLYSASNSASDGATPVSEVGIDPFVGLQEDGRDEDDQVCDRIESQRRTPKSWPGLEEA